MRPARASSSRSPPSLCPRVALRIEEAPAGTPRRAHALDVKELLEASRERVPSRKVRGVPARERVLVVGPLLHVGALPVLEPSIRIGHLHAVEGVDLVAAERWIGHRRGQPRRRRGPGRRRRGRRGRGHPLRGRRRGRWGARGLGLGAASERTDESESESGGCVGRAWRSGQGGETIAACTQTSRRGAPAL